MFYERKIKYLDYMENGERVKNAGFVKIEVRDEECNIDIQIKGVPIKDSITREIVLNGCDKTSSLGEVTLLNGEGDFALHKSNRAALGSKRLAYTELENIQIVVDYSRVIQCVWAQRSAANQKGAMAENTKEGVKSAISDTRAGVEKEAIAEIKTGETENAVSGAGGIEQRQITECGQKTEQQNLLKVLQEREQGCPKKDWELKFPWSRGKGKVHDEYAQAKENRDIEKNVKAAELVEPVEIAGEPVKLLDDAIPSNAMKMSKPKDEATARSRKEDSMNFREDKWSQLISIYPHICPFEDEREYLMIQPRDFVILGSRSYPLVNNSFLLHGYYNYNHLILAKKTGRGEDIYYIGVPGNFYDREKQVAIMFGFESFECKEEPAGHGDYGYYMIRIDL